MEKMIGNKDTRLYTIVYPNPGKETVILLHGGPGVPDGLTPVAEYLSRNYQVITFHQRGTLKSPCYSGNYTIDRYVSDIDQIARYFELQQFHLFGHSWGGLYAQLYAEQYYFRLLSMFLCSPVSGTGSQWVKTTAEIRRFNKKHSTPAAWRGMLKNAALGLLGNDAAYQKFYTQFCLNCNKGYQVPEPVPVLISHINAQPINRTNLAILFRAKPEQLPNPGFKITVTYGDNDVYGASTQYVRERYPTANFITVPDSSHFAWLQNEKQFYNILDEHYGITAAPGITPALQQA